MFQRIFFSAVMAGAFAGAFVFAAFGLAPALLLLVFKRGAAFKALAKQFALVSALFWIVPVPLRGLFLQPPGQGITSPRESGRVRKIQRPLGNRAPPFPAGISGDDVPLLNPVAFAHRNI